MSLIEVPVPVLRPLLIFGCDPPPQRLAWKVFHPPISLVATHSEFGRPTRKLKGSTAWSRATTAMGRVPALSRTQRVQVAGVKGGPEVKA